MHLALWQTEVTSHIKTQLPQQQGDNVGIQWWHGGTNKARIQCQGLITSPRHLFWEQSPPSMLLKKYFVNGPVSQRFTVFWKVTFWASGIVALFNACCVSLRGYGLPATWSQIIAQLSQCARTFNGKYDDIAAPIEIKTLFLFHVGGWLLLNYCRLTHNIAILCNKYLY